MMAMLESSTVQVQSLAWWLRFSVLSSLLVVLSSVCLPLQEQDASKNPFPHYDAGQKHLAAGDEEQASAEFKVYLISVVRSLATGPSTSFSRPPRPSPRPAISIRPNLSSKRPSAFRLQPSICEWNIRECFSIEQNSCRPRNKLKKPWISNHKIPKPSCSWVKCSTNCAISLVPGRNWRRFFTKIRNFRLVIC